MVTRWKRWMRNKIGGIVADEIEELLDELTRPASALESDDRSTAPTAAGAALPAEAPSRARLPRIAAAAVGLLAVVAVALGSYWLGTRSVDESTTADGSAELANSDSDRSEDQAEAATESGGTDVSDGAVEEGTASGGTDGDGAEEDGTEGASTSSGDDASPNEASTETEESTTSVPATLPPIESTEDNPEGAIRWALFSDGKFFLRGYSPSREHADAVVEAVAVAVGPDNVVDEYIIDPAAPLAAPAPIYIEDVILFEAESAELRPEFTALLDLAPAFLAQSPTIKLTVVARTDASGPAAYNLNLARRRANAVVDYYLSIGVDPSQVEADPRGEEGAEETDDPAEAALQRRVEFIVTGLLEE